MEGFLRIPRSILDRARHLSPNEYKLLIRLWEEAAFYEHEARIGQEMTIIKVGQVLVGSRKGEERFGFPKSTLYEILARLSRLGFAGREAGRHGTIITLTDYPTCNEQDIDIRTQVRTNTGRAPDALRTRAGLSEEGEEEKKGRREEKNKKDIDQTGSEAFDRFWSLYPRKVGKETANRAWRRIPNNLHDTLFVDIEWRKQHQWIDPQYIPHPSTYLNGRRWEDEKVSKNGNGKHEMTPEDTARWEEAVEAHRLEAVQRRNANGNAGIA